MYIILALIFLTTFDAYKCDEIKEIFEKINQNVEQFNAIGAEIAWQSTLDPGNSDLVYKSAIFQKENIEWQHRTCDELDRLRSRHLSSSQARQTYLLCRGPKYTYGEARQTSDLYEKLQSIYNNAKICIPTEKSIKPTNLTEVETAILEYLKSADDFLKEAYHSRDPMFAVKIAVNGKEAGLCLDGEDDFQNLMAYSRNEEVLRWLWLVWREKVGPPMKEIYRQLVDVENLAARRNGYSDIGASWRDDQEVANLRLTCRRLHEDIKPLYSLLHGITRFYLRKRYGAVVPELGPIPAHLLGNLWSQNWEPLADLIIPQTIDLDESIAKLNWTVEHMVKRAEDFYQSLGLPPMRESFWRNSLFSRASNSTRCHSSAADMFVDGDFRIIFCSGSTKEDFYVLHHELGHVQYYMAYQHQPALFRQANTALHEAIGDTIMYGVMTPQHLHRLGLINDSLLYSTNTITIRKNGDLYMKKLNNNIYINPEDKKEINEDNNNPTKDHLPNENLGHNEDSHKEYDKDNLTKDYLSLLNPEYNEAQREVSEEDDLSNEDSVKITTDDVLLLKQALSKIPQIPFSLVIDEYRWEYFEGGFTNDVNRRFWELALELQGIAPPVKRDANDFDAGAKFHVPDNTPYIRYFLSSFLQHQLFETVCKGAVFGRRSVQDPLPDSIAMNRCDIYGSKIAGKILRDIMSRGHSQHWRRILQETVGQHDISAAALKRYYRPLYTVLEKLVRLYRIPIGW